jgi:hypothetical protein
VEAVLVLLLLLAVWGLPITAVVVPPVVMLDRRRWSPAAAGLWLAAVALVVCWVAAVLRDMDRVDVTGEQGSWLAGAGWLVAAVLAATASVRVARRPVVTASGTLTR